MPAPVLEPVALQHAGFRIPGLAQDGRGVVVGGEALIFVPGLERLVASLRLLSEEPALGDLLPTLRIEEVKNPLGARGYLLRFRSSDSRTLDRCARAAALCLGSLCVGADRHFVLYRDRRAPLGYDVSELAGESGDYLLYTHSATQAYTRIAELPLLRLLSRLRPLASPGGRRAALRRGEQDSLWLLLPVGLVGRVLRYLWQRGNTAAAALPDALPAPPGPGDRPARSDAPPALSLLQLAWSASAAAHVDLLLQLPGVQALQPLSDQLAVELGYTHPLRLLSFERLFDRAQRHLFLAGEQSAVVLPATPFIPAERLIELRLTAEALSGAPLPVDAPVRPLPRHPLFTASAPPVRMPLRLVSEPTPTDSPTAALVPWTQSRLLGQLLGVLPPPLFRQVSAACIDEGILIVGDGAAVASLSLGRLFYSAAPSVLVPLGHSLVPRLRGDLLQAKIDGSDSGYVVFFPSGAQLLLKHELFGPISAPLFSRLQPPEAHGAPPVAQPAVTRIRNDSLGLLWPLWGSAGLADAVAAAPGDASDDEQEREP